MIGLLVASLLSQQPVPSTVIPPSSEEQIVFTHAGFTYFVGKTSGTVVFRQSANVEPEKPRPKPPPLPDVVSGVKWFSVIVDETKPEQQAWRTNPALRKSLEDRGILFRSYVSEETDIDALGFRTLVGQTGLPTVILQDAAGKLIKVVSPRTMDDIAKIVESIQ